MVTYLRFAVNSHVHNQRHRITLMGHPQNSSSIVMDTIRYVSRSIYYTRNSFGLVKSLFKVTLNQKSEVWTYPNSVRSDGVHRP